MDFCFFFCCLTLMRLNFDISFSIDSPACVPYFLDEISAISTVSTSLSLSRIDTVSAFI